MTEADFMKQVTDLADILGWSWAHFRPAQTKHGWRTPVSGPLGKGWPDLFLVHPSRGTIVAELKSDGGKASPEQEWVLETLRAAGIKAYLWRPTSWDAIVAALQGE